MSVDRTYRSYRFYYSILRFFAGLLIRFRVIGRENIPEGGALVCANHSHWCDPILMAFALTKKVHLHVIGKKELFNVPVLGKILKKIGSFPVDREGVDVSAVRTVLHYLKGGGKVGIFPEGTRTSTDGSVEAKVGAVRMAEMARVPVVPVYIPRRKRLFHKLTVVIGKPYMINEAHKRLAPEAYQELTDQLMGKIGALGAAA